jgi:hypothetical protein
MKVINLVSVNKFANEHPYVFIDTIASVQNLLERCGFTCIISTNKFYPEVMNIVWGVGTHFSHDYKDLLKFISPKNSVIFNMEQIESVSTLITEDYIKFLKQFLVFDYNQHNIKALNKRGITSAVEFPLIPSTKFKIDYDTKPLFSYKYDLAFYGILNNRRIDTLKSIENAGLKVKYIRGSYGQALSRELTDCLAVINIHYYESSIFETARCLRPLAMGIPVISEVSQLPENPNWVHSGVLFADFDTLANEATNYLANKNLLLISSKTTNAFIHSENHLSTAKTTMANVFNLLHAS